MNAWEDWGERWGIHPGTQSEITVWPSDARRLLASAGVGAAEIETFKRDFRYVRTTLVRRGTPTTFEGRVLCRFVRERTAAPVTLAEIMERFIEDHATLNEAKNRCDERGLPQTKVAAIWAEELAGMPQMSEGASLSAYRDLAVEVDRARRFVGEQAWTDAARIAALPDTEKHSLTAPLVHLNGTAKNDLLEQNEEAESALSRAIEAVKMAAPHGRDYPLGDYATARMQHESRMQRLLTVRQEITNLYHEIEKQGGRR